MVKRGILTETESDFKKNETTPYFKSLKPADQKNIQEIKNRYGAMNGVSLMKHTYINYPFWAIKSRKAKEILEETYYQKVLNASPVSDETVLFTIGYYEGISLEEYLVRLIKKSTGGCTEKSAKHEVWVLTGNGLIQISNKRFAFV